MTLEQYRSLTPREQQRWIWKEMQRRAQEEIARRTTHADGRPEWTGKQAQGPHPRPDIVWEDA